MWRLGGQRCVRLVFSVRCLPERCSAGGLLKEETALLTCPDVFVQEMDSVSSKQEPRKKVHHINPT